MSKLKYYDQDAGQWLPVYSEMGSNSFVNNETPSGTINGTNKVFTTSSSYMPGTLEVYVNGLLHVNGLHFVETSPSAGTFTFDEAPTSGDNIIVSYMVSGTNSGNADTLDGYHANATPTANTIPVLDANGKMKDGAINTTYLGYVQIVTPSAGVSLETDVAGLSVTVSINNALRGIRITLYCPSFVGTAGSRGAIRIKEGSTILGGMYKQVTANNEGVVVQAILAASVGSHTYKVSLQRDVGSGDVYLYADSNTPTWLLVEYI